MLRFFENGFNLFGIAGFRAAAKVASEVTAGCLKSLEGIENLRLTQASIHEWRYVRDFWLHQDLN